jgi:hypothetical protein
MADGAQTINGGKTFTSAVNVTGPSVKPQIIVGPTTASTSKFNGIYFTQYTGLPFATIGANCGTTVNRLMLGGNDAAYSCATSVELWAAADVTTKTGTKIVTVDTTGLTVNSGNLTVGNAILSTTAAAARGYNLPESYQYVPLIHKSF